MRTSRFEKKLRYTPTKIDFIKLRENIYFGAAINFQFLNQIYYNENIKDVLAYLS